MKIEKVDHVKRWAIQNFEDGDHPLELMQYMPQRDQLRAVGWWTLCLHLVAWSLRGVLVNEGVTS